MGHVPYWAEARPEGLCLVQEAYPEDTGPASLSVLRSRKIKKPTNVIRIRNFPWLPRGRLTAVMENGTKTLHQQAAFDFWRKTFFQVRVTVLT